MKASFTLVVTLLSCFTKAASGVQIAQRAAPAGYSYLKCVHGVVDSSPPLNSYPANSENGMTLETCALACYGTLYFGVSGTRCSCGNTILSPPSLDRDDSFCDTPCNGNTRIGIPPNEDKCGGNQHTSLYQRNQQFVAPTSMTYKYLGCFQLNVNAFDFQDSLYVQGTLTAPYCQAMCRGFNYFIMAVEDGQVCHCLDQLPSGNYLAPFTACDRACSGSSPGSCGSLNGAFISVYSTPQYPACGVLNTDLRVRNPGFENGMAFWTAASTAPSMVQWQALSRNEAHSGKRLARIVNKGNSAEFRLSQTIPVCPDIRYSLSYYRFSTGGSCTTSIIYDGTTTDDSLVPGSWNQQGVQLIPTGPEVLIQIVVQCSSAGVVYLDDVQLGVLMAVVD